MADFLFLILFFLIFFFLEAGLAGTAEKSETEGNPSPYMYQKQKTKNPTLIVC